MGLRFDPVGGGQFKQAVQQIVEAERQPIKQLEARKKTEEAKGKLFQEFKGKFANFDKTLSEFANFRAFRELKVDVGDAASFVDVTVDKTRAEPGTYQIEVNQLAKRSSVMTNGFENPDEAALGVGYVVFQLPNGDSRELFIDEDKSSLRGIASAINLDKDSPVQASVINDQARPENPWRLILSSKKDGAQEAVDFPEVYFLDGDREIYYEENQSPENAQLKVDGFEIEAGSNSIKEFLTGVNVRLKQARPDSPITITITEDTSKIAGKVKGMVDQVNGILEFINKQNQVDDKTDTKATFAGDTSLQSVEYRLRNLLHEGFPVQDSADSDLRYVFTNQFGIEFEKNGSITFKEDKFKAALEKDFHGVSEAITGEFGIAQQLKKVISGYTRQPDGLIGLREAALKQRIKSIDDDIANKERRVEKKQQSLVEQFSKLEASLSNMQRQSQYLSATLGGGSGGNLVSQLLGG